MVTPARSLPELMRFQPSPPFRSLLADLAPRVALRCANGAGKSYTATYLVSRAAIDNPESHQRLVGPTRHQVREVTGRYLWHWLEPYCHPKSRWSSGTGWNRNSVILLRNGAEIELRSNEDPENSHEGRHDLMRTVLDEVPKQSHFRANLRAKQLILTFTVQSKATPEWLKKTIEGEGTRSPEVGPDVPWLRAEHPTGWVQYVVGMVRSNVPFDSEEEFEEKVAKHRGTEEEGRRLWAKWESSSDSRKFGGWSTVRLVRTRAQLLELLRDEKGRIRIDRARYGIDHGTGIGKQCQYLIFQRGNKFFVVHEWIGGGNTTPKQNAQAMKAAIEMWLGPGVEGLYRLAANDGGCFGDVNSSGPAGAGDSLNQLMERALCELYGIDELPFRIQAPNKEKGYKDAREVAVNHAMLESRWYVNDECRRAIAAYGQYEGKDNDPFKDPVDAQCYGVQDLVLLRDVPGNGVQIARG